MLKVTSKNFEIEEKIQLTKMNEEKEEIVYEFDMQITNDEMQELKHILFDFSKEHIKDYINATKEEKEQLEKQATEEIEKNNERFIDICFKEHKDKFKELAGEYKFEEMLGEIRGYLMGFFMKKQISQMNTPITDLTKIMSNFQRLK